jgi:hypothetical protein
MLMNPQIERVGTALFPDNGGRVANVKFFLGHNRAVSGADLADQLERANAQVRQGAATRVGDLDAYVPC